MKQKSVVIIGAGIGGIFAGWRLTKSGFKVTILEKQKFFGGFATSLKHEGYSIDIGPHFTTLNRNSEITREIFELMGKEKIFELPEIQNWYKSYFKGKFIHGRPTAKDAILANGLKSLLLGLFSLFRSRLFSNIRNKNLQSKDYLISLYGNYLYNNWCEPFLKQTIGTLSPSIDYVKKKFKPIKFMKFFSKSKSTNNFKPNLINNEDERMKCYFKYGMGSLAEELVIDIKKNDGDVITNANIEEISHDFAPKKIIFSINNLKREIDADLIVYATPTHVAKNWFPKYIDQHKSISQKSSFLHSILVFLFIDSPKIYDGWIVGIFDSKIPFFRIAQQSYLSEHVSPMGKSLLSMEIRSHDDDSFWNKNDEEIKNIAEVSLKKIGLLNNKNIEGYKVLKLKNVYPFLQNSDSKPQPDDFFNYIQSITNEYTLVTSQADAGALVGGDQSFDDNETPMGGIHHALLEGNKIYKKIISTHKIL